MTARKYRVVATTRFGGRRLVYHLGEGRYSWRRGKTGKVWLTAQQSEAAKKWVTKRLGKNVRMVGPGQYPFLELAAGARWPTNKRLLRALNKVGQVLRRSIRIISGLRTPHEAWVLRMRYLAGRGNLAARCCSRYTTAHSWAQCGKDPWSNHADGNAADCGVIGRTGGYTSLASNRKARREFQRLGGHFPVVSPYEPWHAEMRS